MSERFVLKPAPYMEPNMQLYLKEEDMPEIPAGRKSHRNQVVAINEGPFRGVFKITSVVFSRYPGFYRVTMRPVDE